MLTNAVYRFPLVVLSIAAVACSDATIIPDDDDDDDPETFAYVTAVADVAGCTSPYDEATSATAVTYAKVSGSSSSSSSGTIVASEHATATTDSATRGNR